jgi:sulfite oxidase
VGTFYGTAVGNSRWAGVRVRDLLRAVGISDEEADASKFRFVHTEAYDEDPIAKQPYGGCVPFEKCWSSVGDAIVAYEMNGGPVPRDHGGPARLLCPGYAGVRNTKWLKKLTASPRDGESTWYTSDVKGCGQRIMEWGVNSSIVDPLPGRLIEDWEDEIEVSGWAFAGGGRAISRVEVSLDDGNTWQLAELECPDQPIYRTWSWTHWSCDLEIPEGYDKDELEICVRAMDVSFNRQPRDILNPDFIEFGVVNNSWHRVLCKVQQPREEEDDDDDDDDDYYE